MGAELLFGLLTDRYERGSVVVTSNLDFASGTEVFGDLGSPQRSWTASPTVAIMEFQGDSLRFKESLRRQGQASP